MTPERLGKISAKWTHISDYGSERQHAEAASEFIPELIEAVEQLQADVERLSQFETAYRHALDAVDEVFQDYSGKSPPILPDFLGLGENKFLGVKKLAKAYLQLQARHARNNDIIRNMCVLLDEDDATLIGTHLVKITAENRALRTENANLLRLLRWVEEKVALNFCAPKWNSEEDKTNARELRRILEGV